MPPSAGDWPAESTRHPLPPRVKLRITAATLVSRSARRGAGNVIVLPFNKILKLGVPANEIAAMEFVRANTTIPLPKILKIYGRQPDGSAHIIMTRIPGVMLSYALRKMTTALIESVASDLSGYLAQMRQLVPPDPTPVIGGTAQGPGYEHRLGSYLWGPFQTVADFHTYVRFGEPLEDWAHKPAVMEVHGKPEGAYKVRYSHADLAPRNIMVDPKKGKIMGIIDWEFGGWYPEYWEYTKMHYCMRSHWGKWAAAIDREEGIEKYRVEKDAEEVIWTRAGPFGYG